MELRRPRQASGRPASHEERRMCRVVAMEAIGRTPLHLVSAMVRREEKRFGHLLVGVDSGRLVVFGQMDPREVCPHYQWSR